MCGRFYLDVSSSEIQDYYDVTPPENMSFKNYNITPSQTIPIILEEMGKLLLEPSQWGLLPNWAKAKNMKPMINARAETAVSKPYFRNAYKYRRCLIPTSGFYEWKRESDNKTPYAITLPDKPIMTFAGLYEEDEDKNYNCAILTIDANDHMREVHHRMPVILNQESFSNWLSEGNSELLSTYTGELNIYPINKRVNSPQNNDPELISPLTN